MLDRNDWWQLGKYFLFGLAFIWLALELKKIEDLLRWIFLATS